MSNIIPLLRPHQMTNMNMFRYALFVSLAEQLLTRDPTADELEHMRRLLDEMRRPEPPRAA